MSSLTNSAGSNSGRVVGEVNKRQEKRDGSRIIYRTYYMYMRSFRNVNDNACCRYTAGGVIADDSIDSDFFSDHSA